MMERIFFDAASDVCISTQSFVVYFDDPVEPIDIEADQEIIKIVQDEMGSWSPTVRFRQGQRNYQNTRWRHQL
jgi:hypothetical protein